MHQSSACPLKLSDMIKLAYLAGGIMRTYFTHFGMERIVKTDATPLTAADVEINRLVIEHIRGISSDVDIVGEEESDRTGSPWQVVCDPVDGTFPYSWGMPVSTFMLGVLYVRQPVMGVIYDPFTERIYAAERGKGAWMNEKTPLKVSRVSGSSDRPIVGYCSWPDSPYNVLRACQYLEERGITLVNFCSVGYVEAAVATGEFAASIFPGTKHHDTAPGHIIVTEAGGKVTDVFGKPLHYTNGEIAGHIMSNGQFGIHGLIEEAIRAAM